MAVGLSASAAHRRQFWLRRTAFGEATAVLRSAVRVLLRHWPVLFALSFAGLGARSLLMDGAVRASKVNGALGFLIVVLVPMTTLTSFVLMMHAIRGSLPWLFEADNRASRGRVLLDHLGSVLIPFLTVYASYGYLKEDFSNYAYAVLSDEVFNNPNVFQGGTVDVMRRLPFSPTGSVIAVVIGSIVIRFVLGKWQLARRHAWLGIIGAYVEVIWISLVAGIVSQVSGSSKDWVKDRRVVHGLTDGFTSIVDRLGPLTRPGHAVLSVVGELLGSVDTVIVVPVAWLAVGAVLYGYKIIPPAPLAHELLDLANQRWSRLPGVVRRIGAEAGASLRERFGPLLHGLQLLVRTGLRPMLLFCLAFLVVQSASDWLWEAERWLIGPQDLNRVWTPLAGVLSVVNDGVGTVLLVTLLGAAVDRVLGAQEDRPAPATRPASAVAAAVDVVPAESPAAAPGGPAPVVHGAPVPVRAPAPILVPVGGPVPAVASAGPGSVVHGGPVAVAETAIAPVARPPLGWPAPPPHPAGSPYQPAPPYQAASAQQAVAHRAVSTHQTGSPHQEAPPYPAAPPYEQATAEQPFVDPPTVEHPLVGPPGHQGGVSRA